MSEVVGKMKILLGSVFGLYADTHAAHWNVESINFNQLHLLFKGQYEDLWESLDDIAEHIRALDAYAPQSLAKYAELNQLQPLPEAPFELKEMITVLKEGHEQIVDMMTEINVDAQKLQLQGLSNYLCARIEAHNKMRWMLRASIM